MLTLTQVDNGKSFEAHPGDQIVIQLAENPTTGFRWAIEAGSQESLTPIGSEYVQAPESGVGGGGHRQFTFQALNAGRASLNLKHWREWEGEDSIMARYAVDVIVKE